MINKSIKKLLLCLIAIGSFLNLNFAQVPFIKNNGVFTYYTGNIAPATNWKSVDFDDATWQKADTCIIGYGWPKKKTHNKTLDSLVIDTTTNLFIRINFEVTDKNEYSDLNFEADYNDGYVAYLNGEEIARKNVGRPGEETFFNQLANKSHEQTTYRKDYTYYGPVNGVYIDSLTVKRLLRNGKNIFAVQVVNDSINGADLSFRANVYNILKSTPNWYYGADWVKYYRQMEVDSSKFPLVFIDTDEFGIPLISDIPKLNMSKKVVAKMRIIDKKGQYNKVDMPIDFESRISIARRGESSKDFPKMCFNIETQDYSGENLDTAILGLPADNDWILYSSYGDKTLLRNELTFEIGERLGHYVPRTQFCEFVLNGEYQGLYIFTEKIKQGKNRVTVANRDSLNPSNGGYVFKYDKPSAGVIQYVSPKASDITQKEKDYLLAFQKSIATVMKSPNFLDPELGYQKYISGKSLIDYVLINELTKNCDSYLFSTYFHKDKDSKDGRLKYGPLWDFDLAYCGAAWQEGDKTYGWQFALPSSSSLYVPQLFRDTTLSHQYARRWFQLRNGVLSNDSLFGILDSMVSHIASSRIKNYQVWPILDKNYLWPVYITSTYDDDIWVIKNWLTARLDWIDKNINLIDYPFKTDVVSRGKMELQLGTFPNPYTDHFSVSFWGEQANYRIDLIGIDGKKVSGKSIDVLYDELINVNFSSLDLSNCPSGIYFLRVLKNGQLLDTKKVIKL
jgi:hypothetical protein